MYSRRAFSRGIAATGLAVALGEPARAAEPEWQKLPTEPYKGKQDDISFVDPDTGWYGNGCGASRRAAPDRADAKPA